MTSKYGKSAVDATRRNMLPLFLDDALKALEDSSGSGGGGTTLNVTLGKDDWTLSGTEYQLNIPISLDKLDGSAMVFPEGSDSLAYAKADIQCIFDENLSAFTFSTKNKPTVDLQVVVLMIGTNLISAEKVKF